MYYSDIGRWIWLLISLYLLNNQIEGCKLWDFSGRPLVAYNFTLDVYLFLNYDISFQIVFFLR